MINKLYEKFKKYIKENYKFLLAIVFICFFFLYELPFVIYRPGGVIDLDNRIVMEEKQESSGTLGMSYVSMMKGNIPFVLLSFLIPNWDLVSSKDITYEGVSVDETIKVDKVLLENGLDNAIFSAYSLAGKPVDIKKINLEVIYLAEEAHTNLAVGDKILEVDEIPVSSLEDIAEVLKKYQANDTVKVKALRNEKEINCEAKLYELDGQAKMGVSVINDYEYEMNPQMEIKTKESESGSSGGLMTALAIYNALVEEDITKGRKIVGTGTIAQDGTVGEIGGVKYKLLGAAKKKADIFICPQENYEEALKVKEENNLNIEVLKAGTLKEAVLLLH